MNSKGKIVVKVHHKICAKSMMLAHNKFGAQKQRLNEILRTIWFDEKIHLKYLPKCHFPTAIDLYPKSLRNSGSNLKLIIRNTAIYS